MQNKFHTPEQPHSTQINVNTHVEACRKGIQTIQPKRLRFQFTVVIVVVIDHKQNQLNGVN